MMKKFEGYELIYPDGCKEINENLKPDELRRRLGDIIKSLEEKGNDKYMSTDALLNKTDTDVTDTSHLKLEGLLMHLTSEMFIDHEDSDIQLRVAVCICNILKLYCPENPFLSFSDSKSRIKMVLIFLLKCHSEMKKLKSKADKHFLNLYKIFSICSQTNVFHWFTVAEDGENVFSEYIRTCFIIVRKFHLWSEDNKALQILCDSLVVVINANDVNVSDNLVSLILNFLLDRFVTKEQKHLSTEIISRCIHKLEDSIQSIIQSQMIKSEMKEDFSDPSDIEDCGDTENDFFSVLENKIDQETSELQKDKGKSKTQKPEKKKTKMEKCFEFSCEHTFQLIYELFKIQGSIITPLLPSIEMKLRSPNNVTDRKRACRLLGKLFVTFAPNISDSQSSLWECFLGRFSDIGIEVRKICVKVAGDILKKAVSGECAGILSVFNYKEDLVKVLQKRSHDQEEQIRQELVMSISQIFDNSNAIVVDEELDFVHETLFKILLDRTRDKCAPVRKEAIVCFAKLYRRILTNGESRHVANGNIGEILGLENLLAGQRNRLELLLGQILRLYLRVEVEDKIVVERLFHTKLVPFKSDSSGRMRALIQCFTICEDSWLLSIQELFKTQVIILKLICETIDLIRDSYSEKILSPSVSQKLKDKVKRLSEYVPGKDRVECLTKFFLIIRSDKKLFEIVSRLVNPESSREIILKTIFDIKNHLSASQCKTGKDSVGINIQKKPSFISTIKCLLERSAPIIVDMESVQELISLLISSNEALESSKQTKDYTISVIKSLKLMHIISIIYRNTIPTQEAYLYVASIISKFNINSSTVPTETTSMELFDDKQSTPSSIYSVKSTSSTNYKNIPTTIEELCLLTLARIINFGSRETINNNEEKVSANQEHSKVVGLFTDESETQSALTLKVVHYLINCATNGSIHPFSVPSPRSTTGKLKAKDRRNVSAHLEVDDREQCVWKYSSRVAKLATRCLLGLYFCYQQESRKGSTQFSEILSILETKLDELVQNCDQCELFSFKQLILMSTLSQLGLHLRQRHGAAIHRFVQETVLMRILTDEKEANSSSASQEPRNLTFWTNNNLISLPTQVRIQALKMLSKWMVTLKVDEDRNLILSVMVCLRKYIGSYGNKLYNGNMTDGDMAQMRLAAGKCWLGLAQVQLFLSIFDVKWLHRLSSLIYDPCPQVREGFLRKLHKGLFRLQLPLDYMAMFAFVPRVSSPDYLITAKNYFSANVTRRREFLDRNQHYLTDAKLLFAVLPEYVLAFVIHMLAHDVHWTTVDDQPSIQRVKQCLWFVMEPILKLNENSSFIRKLLEKIKHAQDSSNPNNVDINEKLYISCDIALGLLISKQASYDLKEYPVELKLPRTRYQPAPDSFFNPDFANILLENPSRVRIQFSPTHKSKQMMMNFMPAPLIKGHPIAGSVDNNKSITNTNGNLKNDIENENPSIKPIVAPSKSKKYVAKIVVGLPEMESEGKSCQIQPSSSSSKGKTNNTKINITDTVTNNANNTSINNKNKAPTKRSVNIRKVSVKRKNSRTDSPIDEFEEFDASPSSVTKRGRVCKPNIRVMKDMISLSRKSSVVTTFPVVLETKEISPSQVRLEGMVSVNLERMQTSLLQHGNNNLSNNDDDNQGTNSNDENDAEMDQLEKKSILTLSVSEVRGKREIKEKEIDKGKETKIVSSRKSISSPTKKMSSKITASTKGKINKTAIGRSSSVAKILSQTNSKKSPTTPVQKPIVRKSKEFQKIINSNSKLSPRKSNDQRLGFVSEKVVKSTTSVADKKTKTGKTSGEKIIDSVASPQPREKINISRFTRSSSQQSTVHSSHDGTPSTKQHVTLRKSLTERIAAGGGVGVANRKTKPVSKKSTTDSPKNNVQRSGSPFASDVTTAKSPKVEKPKSADQVLNPRRKSSSHGEISVRSKRVASQMATDQLKRMRIV